MKRLSLVASLWLSLVMAALVFGGGQVLGQTNPSFTVPSDQTYARNETITTLTIPINDLGTDPGRTAMATDLPSGLSGAFAPNTLTISGTVALDAADQDADGRTIDKVYTVTVTADDKVNAAVTKTFTITVDAGIVVEPTTLSNVFDAATGVLNSDVKSGDEITFEAGTYNVVEDITIDKPLTLTTGDGDYRTPGDGEDGAVFIGAIRLIIDSDNVTIQGFKFKDTDVTGFAVDDAVVWVRAQGNTEIDGVHILDNSFTNIGGFGITSKTRSADLRIIGNSFYNIGEDTPDRLTTAIQLTGGQSAVKKNGMVSGNTIDIRWNKF